MLRSAVELRPGANLDCAVSMLVGAFYARYLAGSQISAEFPRQLVETVWAGIAAPAEAGHSGD